MRRLLALLCAPMLALSALSAPAMSAPAGAAGPGYRPSDPQIIPAVRTRDVPPIKAVDKAEPAAAPVPVFPTAGSTVVSLGTKVSGMPIGIAAAKDSPSRAKVTLLDRAATTAAGLKGVLLRVEPDGAVVTSRATVGLTVDYASFATAYGGDWASRLRLVSVPECALSTPEDARCAPVPLPSTNDIGARTVTATVGLGSLVATESAPAGGNGDYTATKLQASSTWTAGANSGDFAWSYEMAVPPAVGGPAPKVELMYSSQSVDGKMAANNNQPEWAGAGFDLTPGGSIERRYKGCGEDITAGSSNNDGHKTGDLCWGPDNAVLNLRGHSGELIYNAVEGRWHLRHDDGTRVERRSGTANGASNGDDNGEWWVVTTTEGTQFWFGRDHLPGWTTGAGTKSAWTVPVFGNDANEPCHAATFAASACPQAWRWNLDYVIDMNGNSMSLWYDTAINQYAKDLQTSSPVQYIRDGWLKRIDYGTRSNKDLATDPSQSTAADSIFAGLAPMEVQFLDADRCAASCSTKDGTHWPDTPWDLECTGAPCNISSPSFWSTRRLGQVVTNVLNGGSYRAVQAWTLKQIYKDPGDSLQWPLVLDKLGHSGGADVVPDMAFDYATKSNRVDPVAADGLAPMNWFRISKITTETGATVNVSYSDVDCVAGGKLPSLSALQNNTYRCFPVKWTPEGETTAKTEFFHKYVVTEVRENDATGGTVPFGSYEVKHTYSYPTDAAAWHYTDDDGLIKADNKTWSVWRGYAKVGVTTGNSSVAGDTLEFTETSYFRGMHGDHLPPSGTRNVPIDPVDMNGDGDTTDAGVDAPGLNDEDAFAGTERKTVTYNGPGGAEVSSQVYRPWRSAATATRLLHGVTVESRLTGQEETRNREALDHSPWWRTTSSHTEFDSYGMAVKEDDFGDDATAADNQCTVTSYARNTGAWLIEPEKEVTRFALPCASAGNPAALAEADVISNVRDSYDGLAWGATPAKGMLSAVAKATAWNAGNPTDQAVVATTYDAQGRVKSVTDELGYITTTDYTPSAGGPLTRTVVTRPDPFRFTTTTDLDPAFGLAIGVTDTNQKKTTKTYDGFGRLKGVWLPDRSTSLTASAIFDYKIYATKPSALVTKILNPIGGYDITYSLLDGMLRDRQTQAAAPNGGRIVTDTFYDSAGRVRRTYGSYYDNRGAPGETLVAPVDLHTAPEQTYRIYDGAGRVTDEVFDPYNNGEKWRTHTVYTGDRTDVTPPSGGTTTSTFTDARGNTTALWQYGYPTTSDHVTTSYRYNRRGQLDRITDTAGNLWDYTYHLAGNLKTSKDPDSGTTTFGYDKAGQLTSKQDTASQKLVYTYDSLRRKTGMYLGSVAAANKRATWSYDGAFFDGTATPVNDKPSRSSRWTGGGTTEYAVAVAKYDNGYRPKERVITIPSTEDGVAGTYRYKYTYRANGSAESVEFPPVGDVGAEATTIEYDLVTGKPFRLTAVDELSELSYVSATAYDNLARISKLTLFTGLYSGTGYKTYLSYNHELDTGRLSSIKTERENGTPNVVSDVTFGYDNAGNVTKMVDPAGGDNQCFSYDKLRRLTEAWTPSSTTCGTPSIAALGGAAKYWTTWSVNAVGNRTQQLEHATVAGGTDKTTGYVYPTAGATQPHGVTATTGAVVGTYKYDVNGNTTCRPAAAGNVCPPTGSTNSQVLSWDPEGRLSSNGSTSYVYDADGNRLIAADSAGRTLFLPGQELRYTASNQAVNGTRYYEYQGQPVASRKAAGLSWLSGDHHGTATIAINEATQAATIRRQTPFGAPRGSAAWVNSQGFVGGTVDPTGLTHVGAREYDPALGRFVSVDPLFNQKDPQSMNNYTYANHSPSTTSDPTGTINKDPSEHNGTPQCHGSEHSGGCGSGEGKGGKPSHPSDNGNGGDDSYNSSDAPILKVIAPGTDYLPPAFCQRFPFLCLPQHLGFGTIGLCFNAGAFFYGGGGGEVCIQTDKNGVFFTATGAQSFYSHKALGAGGGMGLTVQISDATEKDSLKNYFKYKAVGVPFVQGAYTWGHDDTYNKDVHVIDGGTGINVGPATPMSVSGGENITAVSGYVWDWCGDIICNLFNSRK